MKKIKNTPKFDRPREKMEQKGAKALSNLELLAVLLGSGIKGKDVFEVAKDILKLAQNDFESISLEKLKEIEGVGMAKACQIMAAIEFSKRFLIKDRIKIKNIVHPREVFADAISDRAAGIIFVHNHPSGNPEPSKEDITITNRLLEVAKIVDIDVIDHIIIVKDGHFSFQAEGMLKADEGK